MKFGLLEAHKVWCVWDLSGYLILHFSHFIFGRIPDMTEILLTGSLSLNPMKQTLLSLRIHIYVDFVPRRCDAYLNHICCPKTFIIANTISYWNNDHTFFGHNFFCFLISEIKKQEIVTFQQNCHHFSTKRMNVVCFLIMG